MQVTELTGTLVAPTARFGLIVGRFNSFIVDSLVSGAIDALQRQAQVPAENIAVVRVPGAFEIPLMAQRMAATGQYDALIALGAVIRGGTPHFDFVAGECNSGLSKVALEHNLPVANGVLTTESIEQAIERAGTKAGNKGVEAALSAVEMVTTLAAVERHHG